MRATPIVCAWALTGVVAAAQPPAWTTWPAAEAERVGASTVVQGRIEGGRRVLNTERARNYKLVATWLTPDVIHAGARLLQLRSRLTDEQANRFWVVFPLTAADGQPLSRDSDAQAELVVRILEREGRVSWPVPASSRARPRATR